jgi:predicted ATPase/DNA-binding XRE family transcriptional regulator
MRGSEYHEDVPARGDVAVMTIESPVSFGDQLKRHRMRAGLTQEALAERARLSARGISDLERGRRTAPYYDTVRLLANALDLSAEDRAAFIAAARGLIGPADPENNLPIPLTALIGRTAACAAVGRLLARDDVRLVTLTGPGGVGKTRLMLQVVGDMRPAFPDGVFFLPLAALRDAGRVLATIAHKLEIREVGDAPPLARVVALLRPKRLLLVLDNFEHLLAAAPVVSDLLAACPELKIAVTSRTLLHLTDEYAYAVPPLALPDLHGQTDLEGLSRIPAAALFLERLSNVGQRLAVTETDVQAIAEVCVRVDGLPLAIELAAARCRYLSVRELAARLQRRLQILTQGPRDLPERQRTLRDTIRWSYELLQPGEQRFLRRLSVFAGGWTLDSAEAMGTAEDEPPGAVMDGLAMLVDSNLVQVGRDTDGRVRYWLLETIREFAEEQLATSGEEEAIRRCHTDVLLAYTDRAERGLQSGERTAWSRSAADELDNVRAALRWSLDHHETERALRIIGNLNWFWDTMGRDAEGWAWSQEALDAENADRDGWGYARALSAAGALAWNIGHFVVSAQLLVASVARFRALGDRRSLGQALLNLALTRLYQGDEAAGRATGRESVAVLQTVDDPWNLGLALFAVGEMHVAHEPDAARTWYERSLAVLRSVGDPWGISHALTGLGGLAMCRRDYGRARALMEEGLALRRAVNNQHAIATSLTSLGELARREGDDQQAIEYLEQGLARFRDAADAEHVAWTLYNLGLVAVHSGDAAGAAAAFAECLVLRAEQGNNAQIAKAVAGVASAAMMQGEVECAARLWGAVERMREAHGVMAPTDEDGDEEQRTVAHVRATLGAQAASDEFAVGRALTAQEALQLAHLATRPPIPVRAPG